MIPTTGTARQATSRPTPYPSLEGGESSIPHDAYLPTVYVPGLIESVQGELYLVSEDMLRSMDRYEGEGFLYLRKLVSVMIDGQTENAFVYLYAHEIDESRRMKGRWGDE